MVLRRIVALAGALLVAVVALGATLATALPSAAAQTAPDATTTTSTTTTTAATTLPRVSTTLKAGGEPVEGVELVVALDGVEVGRSATDESGSASVEVPGAATYTVSLDESTFPDGVAFASGARTELTPTVRATGTKAVVFRLASGDETTGGSGGAGGDGTFTRVLNLLVSGTRFGLVIALGAVGLSLIFGTTGLTNFAHGEMLTFGAIVAWYLNSNAGGLGWPLLVAGLVAVVASAGFGAGMELGVYRPLRKRGMPIFSQMVVSIGLAFAIRYLYSVVYGSSTKQYSQYAAQPPTLELGPLAMRPKDLIVSAIALAALIAVGLFLRNSRMGTAVRAVSDNRDLSIASGIDDLKVILVVWVLSGALAGLAGVMLGSSESVGYTMGQRVLLVMFAAVLLGGLGTSFGAMVGGLIVGIVSDLSTLWLDADLKVVVALATLVVVLLTRPQGIFGVKARTA
ncbi:MAG: branched-chain amino acid ABC transporter permease [Microthrixaceae bacterium]|nr:branched-chain amino acid ABC transporter permease [Microthrixaceae bacterium]